MFHTACLLSNGSILTWGRNVELQLGINDKQVMFTSTPQTIAMSTTVFPTSISAGKYHTAILDGISPQFPFFLFKTVVESMKSVATSF